MWHQPYLKTGTARIVTVTSSKLKQSGKHITVIQHITVLQLVELQQYGRRIDLIPYVTYCPLENKNTAANPWNWIQNRLTATVMRLGHCAKDPQR